MKAAVYQIARWINGEFEIFVVFCDRYTVELHHNKLVFSFLRQYDLQCKRFFYSQPLNNTDDNRGYIFRSTLSGCNCNQRVIYISSNSLYMSYEYQAFHDIEIKNLISFVNGESVKRFLDIIFIIGSNFFVRQIE